jgi:hypothetical protein
MLDLLMMRSSPLKYDITGSGLLSGPMISERSVEGKQVRPGKHNPFWLAEKEQSFIMLMTAPPG